MNIIRKTLKLSKEEYFKRHLLLINYALPVQMTAKEAEVLGLFISFEGSIAVDPFGTTGRKIVKEKLGLSAGGLGNYLKQLKAKGFIVEKDGILEVLPVLIPNIKEQGYQFKLIANESDS